jgi:hypothetical protein
MPAKATRTVFDVVPRTFAISLGGSPAADRRAMRSRWGRPKAAEPASRRIIVSNRSVIS